MKWSSRHRQADPSHSTLSGPVHQPLPHLPVPVSSHLTPSIVDLASDHDSQSSAKSSTKLTALIITKDIEALLEQDELVRAQERREQEEREAKFGRLNRVAPFQDPNSVVRGLPPPPRARHPRKHKIQSEQPRPMQSGRHSDITGDENMNGHRPSLTDGATAAPSVSTCSSIKNSVSAEVAETLRMGAMDTHSETQYHSFQDSRS